MTAKTVIGSAALLLTLACEATAAGNPQRCTARLERVDAGWVHCAHHCMQRGRDGMPGEPSMEDVDAAFNEMARCTDQCTARRDLVRAHAATSLACSADQIHDACTRLLQRGDPIYMRCRYRCASEAMLFPDFDRSACDQTCSARDQLRMKGIVDRPACQR